MSRLGATPVSSAYSVTVPGVPPQPSISATDYEDGTITLYATVSEDGGYPVTEYKAACRSENSTAIVSSSTSPITVSGLTNGVAYVCSVTATNALGTSVASLATAPIIPEERVCFNLVIFQAINKLLSGEGIHDDLKNPVFPRCGRGQLMTITGLLVICDSESIIGSLRKS